MKPLQDFQDSISKQLFGLTLAEAHSTNICIACKAPVDSAEWEPIDIDEYLISGLCPACFDGITKGDEND